MAEHATDYTHGHMDIREQQASFEGFMLMSKWGSLAVAVIVLFATLTFCTETGWFGSAIWSVILLALGIFFLREKPAAA
jgi:hypothetical protein